MTIRHIRIGVDTGGTFTDVVAVDEDTGRLVATKTPSTPADPAEGFVTGVRKVLGLLGAAGSEISSVSHGTTVATNQLLEGRIGRLGFITTEGYEFVLEIARQSVPDGYGNSYFWVKPDRIVPADRVRTVGGRLDFRGDEVRPFDQARAVQVAREFRDRGVTTLGVCFLHSYANPAHELRMRDTLAREHPGAVVSISSDVLREYREYERSVTTLVDAAVKPAVASYIASLVQRLGTVTGAGTDPLTADAPGEVPFHVMKSNGGVLSAEEVVHQPITTVLSGPAAGALGAAGLAQRAGIERVLTLDGGGTSTDVAVVLGGEPSVTTEGSVGPFPSKIPMIDVVTVGAGGGSIAWTTPEGTLKVGPRSAGADPGPLCYGRGGQDVTVTDAHVLLGRMPQYLLGGEIPLDVAAARTGLAGLAARLGLGLQACAAGVLEISAWNQANALRQVTVKRGLDLRDFTMAAFGGSGPLLACRLVDLLGLQAALVPPDPGNVSALGLLSVDVRNDYVQTEVVKHRDLDPTRVAAVLAGLQDRAADGLDRERFPRSAHRYQRSADLRYFGQAFEVRVPVPDRAVDRGVLAEVADAFHDAHQALYGYSFRADPSQPVEWVNLRVTGIGPIRRPELRPLPAHAAGTGRGPARTATRPVWFESPSGYVETPVYARADLPPAAVLSGPAIIEEFGSTIPLHPGFRAEVDGYGNLLLSREPA